MNRIVLAYSGGLTTSVAIPWLAATYDAEVVTVTLDLGQGLPLTHVRERALSAGAVRAHVIDARDEFVRGYILPALQAGALAGRPFSTELSRPLIAKRLVDIARMESASAVAHGCACNDEDRARLDAAITALDPSLRILAPACEWTMTPNEVADYARERRIPVAAPGPHDDIDANVWGRTIYGAQVSDSPYTLTRASGEGPDTPAFMDIEFESGVPVRTNGVEMPMIELIESLETIAGTHGVGRYPAFAEASAGRPAGDGDAVAESPAAFVLSRAHAALAARIPDAELSRLRGDLSRVYAGIIERGHWFSPLREAIDGFARALAPRVTGSVRVKLLKGTCEVVG